MRNYFCPECGATLDAGERCDCIGFRIKARTTSDEQKEKAATAATVAARPKGVFKCNTSITHSKYIVKSRRRQTGGSYGAY